MIEDLNPSLLLRKAHGLIQTFLSNQPGVSFEKVKERALAVEGAIHELLTGNTVVPNILRQIDQSIDEYVKREGATLLRDH